MFKKKRQQELDKYWANQSLEKSEVDQAWCELKDVIIKALKLDMIVKWLTSKFKS